MSFSSHTSTHSYNSWLQTFPILQSSKYSYLNEITVGNDQGLSNSHNQIAVGNDLGLSNSHVWSSNFLFDDNTLSCK